MADSLEVEDVEAAAWYRRQAEEAGSISHWPDDADPECPDAEDAGVEVGVAWRKAATAFGLDPGTIVLWFSGNEAYDRRTGANLLVDAPRGPLEAVIRGVLYAVRAVAPTVVLGPLPRFWVDSMLPWEHTAAYRLDRKVKESAAEGEFVSLGKCFTTKMSKRHVVLDKARAWFRRDGVHLTREGYCKVAAVDTFPTWLSMDAWDA
ncbi:hypothetical protein FJT64_020845 [Amphibalanus amphitrite]|uniref:Isoamyl acetate-hydrolyzing esterase 1 n=1 Tax=Amphibalanus amphitrite TaxID=1232801 RepID=A0A6A4WRF0_AMPAM|nr:hypothetical protein FJT64_020845 [Amphibalanus amphitrite]